MGCSQTKNNVVGKSYGKLSVASNHSDVSAKSASKFPTFRSGSPFVWKDKSSPSRISMVSAAILIQSWYRRYKAKLEKRRRYTWNIFQQLEYAGEQTQHELYNFFNDILMSFSDNPATAKYRQLVRYGSRGSHTSLDLEDQDLHSLVFADNLKVEPNYKGVHLTFPLDSAQVQQLITSFSNKEHLHARYLMELLYYARKALKKQPNVVHITTQLWPQITVCGDFHGQLEDVLLVFYKNGIPSSDNPYLINGDFVDRGAHSVEVAAILLALAQLTPPVLYINRGNHEDNIVNLRYGFIKEVMSKYKSNASQMIQIFGDVFSWLPLATIIDNEILVCHGGVSDSTNIPFLERIDRHKFISVLRAPTGEDDDELLADSFETRSWRQLIDLLWSDPRKKNGCFPNTYRGGGSYFGPDVTERVLERHSLKTLIRSHECRPEGYEWVHGDKVLTIFSASNYYSAGSNRGAYVRINEDHQIVPFKYSATRKFNIDGANLTHRVSLMEESAIRELKDKFVESREDLIEAFLKLDSEKTGKIPCSDWCVCVENVLQLGLPWHILRKQLVKQDSTDDRFVVYNTSFEDCYIENTFQKEGNCLTEVLYQNKPQLEIIFRMMDKDNSGLISMEEFMDACRLLAKVIRKPLTEQVVKDIASSIDFNKDGYINFNEFLEAFRLVSLSVKC